MPKNRIVSFFHCRKCVQELPAGLSPREYASVEVGLTINDEVQVWCKRHNEEIVVLAPRELLGRRHEKDA